MSTTESAVRRCVKAYYDACDIEDPHDTGLDPDARYRVHLAYRHAMPYLLPDPDSIDAFLACVTHGLVIQVFAPAEASKLLYAAQVAIGSSRARTQAARQNSKSDSKPAPTPSPLPPGKKATAPQVPQAPEFTRKDIQAARNQVDELLEQFYAGKLPAESPLTPCAAVLKAAPPTPSPLQQLAAPQVPAPQAPPPLSPKGENTLLRAAS